MNHCSNCGERIVGEQQFCRSCGAELFVEPGKRSFRPLNLIVIGLLSVLVSALVVMTGKFVDSKTIAFIGTILALLSFAVMVTGSFLADSPRRRRRTTARSEGAQTDRLTLEKADTTNRLPPIPADDHFPASITEETTTRLRTK